MNELLLPQIIIDPTKNSHIFPSLLNSYNLLFHFKPIKIWEEETQEIAEVILTHPVFKFEKPERKSKKTGLLKEAGKYAAVFDPERIGTGSFGGVYPVVGVWKLVGEQWIFKTKSDPAKERLVKTNIGLKKIAPSEVLKSYISEQRIGEGVEHMGYKYPPTHYKDINFLLIRKQEGVTLASLIKQLKEDPNYISVTERLIITINLLKGLAPQIHEVKTRSKTGASEETIAHRDIKPSNIIIGSDFSIKYIDYGLAKRCKKSGALCGTPVYIDPKNYDQTKIVYDHISDLASLSRTIAEFWGDYSGSMINTVPDLIYRNRNDIVVGLLKGISGLNEKEYSTLEKIITSMISYDESDRYSKEKSLKKFEELLAVRLVEEQKQFLINVTTRPLMELSPAELFAILNSPKMQDFLNRFETSPKYFFLIMSRLKDKLSQMDEHTLVAFTAHYLTLNEKGLIPCLLKIKELSTIQLNIFIKLSAPLDSTALKYWLESEIETGQELRWATICRTLYQSTTDADEVLAHHSKHNNSFKSVYIQHFLKSTKIASDEKTNVRLVKRHLEVMRKHQPETLAIKDELSYPLKDTPLALAILASDLLNKDSKNLVLAEDVNLTLVLSKLKNLNSSIKKLNKLPVIEGMPTRNKAICSLLLMVDKVISLDDCDWADALSLVSKINKQLSVITDMDFQFNRLKKNAAKAHFSLVPSEFDPLYQLPLYKSYRLQRRVTVFSKAFKVLEQIEEIKLQMDTRNVALQSNSLLDEELNRCCINAGLHNARDFYQEIKKYYKTYTLLSLLFTEISNQTSNLSDLENYTDNLLTEIQLNVSKLLPKKKLEYFMIQLRTKTNEIVDKKRVLECGLGFFNTSHTFYSPLKGQTSIKKELQINESHAVLHG